MLLLAEVLVVYAGRFPAIPIGLAALGVALCGLEIGRRRLRAGLPASRSDWLRVGRAVGVCGWTLAVLVVFVHMLFPAEVVDDGHFVNVFAHAIGFGYGVVVAGWGYRDWRTAWPG